MRLKGFSAFGHAEAHLTRQTSHGAIVTVLGVILGIALATHEISYYVSGRGESKMMVDLARRHDLNVHVDISFPAIPCAGLSVDVMDASGTSGNDANHAKGVHLHKMRLDQHGKRIGGKDAEYQTPQSQKMVQDKTGTVMQIDLGAAMTQMSDMDTEMQQHEGCRVFGELTVRRVAGRLHFAVHQQSFIDVLPQMLTGHVLPRLTNMSHVIHKVSFGPEFPGQVNPLDGFKRINGPNEDPHAYKYFLKIVPTVYHTRVGVMMETSQYSVGEYAMPLRGPNGNGNGNHHPQPTSTQTQPGHPADPKDKDGNVHKIAQGSGVGPAGAGASGGDTHPTSMVQNAFVDFSYDLSPIVNEINASPGSLLHFMVRLCAVVGGVLSVTRMADKIVHALLVSAGYVTVPRTSGGGGFSKVPSRGYSSNPGSARTSLPGDATAYVSGPGSNGGALPYVPSRSSYGGAGGVSSPMHSLNSYPVRTSSGGGSALGNQHSFPASGVQATDAAGLHQRAAQASHPGSHPLSRMTSSGSSALSGGGMAPQLSSGGAAPGTPVAPGSFGGGGRPMVSYGSGKYGSSIGSLAGGPGSGAGGTLVGDAIPLAASGSGAAAGFGSGSGSGQLGPAAAGQVSHLLGAGGSLPGGVDVAGGGVGGVGGGRPYSSSGGGAPLQQQAAGYSASRLGAAPGPPGQYGAR